MKCERCKRKENVVMYPTGYKFRGHPWPEGTFCLECIHALMVCLNLRDPVDKGERV